MKLFLYEDCHFINDQMYKYQLIHIAFSKFECTKELSNFLLFTLIRNNFLCLVFIQASIRFKI